MNINLQPFFIQYDHITYERGERIIRPNELTSYVIFVKSGIFKTFKTSKNGREIVMTITNATSHKGVILGIEPHIKNYTISALSDVEVFRAPKEEFLTYLRTKTEKYPELLDQLSESLAIAYQQMEILKSGDAYYKIASTVYYLGKETGKTEKTSLKLGFRITHQMIANITGLTRETVTVQLNKLRTKNYIEYEDNILKIKNINNLAKLIKAEG